MDNTNALNWFEIPATDIERAKIFYNTIFNINMGDTIDMMGMKMAMFPSGEGKVGGGLVQGPMHQPSANGNVVYLNANPDMDGIVGRIESAGGKVTMPKTQISPEIGYMAFFTDSEGNSMALHSNN